MNDLPAWLQEVDGAVRIEVLVQPRASRTRVVGEHDGRLKIQITAPPVEGEANEALITHVASQLGVPKRSVQVLAGATGRRKSLRIEDVDPRAVLEGLASKVP